MHVDDRLPLNALFCERPTGENDARRESEEETAYAHLFTSAMGHASNTREICRSLLISLSLDAKGR